MLWLRGLSIQTASSWNEPHKQELGQNNIARKMWSVDVLVLVICFVAHVSGHADMIDPPSRGLLGKYHTPWGVNCGGLSKQIANGGLCGPCGDDITQGMPRDMEEGGKYGKAGIGKTYNEGETISIVVRVTANHKGFFDFKLCPSANVTRRTKELEQCLNEYPLDIIDTITGTRDKVWPLGNGNGNITNLELVLPTGVTCAHCVLRWDWIGGNNCCGNPQEQFRNCMDIEIVGDSVPTPPAPTPAPPPAPTEATLTSCPPNHVLKCTPVAPLPAVDCLLDWCTNECQAKSNACTSDRCKCRCEFQERKCTYMYGRYIDIMPQPNEFCENMCNGGFCSKKHCDCNYY
ncbi:uncharacterized protein LOC132556956 [Ylistrum balloti]|uniref:uncharacterized protein LOC132556956 n=1 Tax=Ylistrum balloti TaxID=509963 RepID=UPI002905A0BE|nr:uncharacterized protein LOC132556956 [Ylistrum balloti]